MPNDNAGTPVLTEDQFYEEVEIRDTIVDSLWQHYRRMVKGKRLDVLPAVFHIVSSLNSQLEFLREHCGKAYSDTKPNDLPTVDALAKNLFARVDEDISELKTMLNVE